MNDSASDKIAIEQRALGEQERLLNNIHRFGGLTGVQVMHLEGPLSSEKVRAGLNWLQAQHPLLRAHMKILGPGIAAGIPWFYWRRAFRLGGTRPIPLKLIRNAQPDDWLDEMQRQLNKPVSGRKMPQVRAVLMRIKDQPEQNIFMLATNHAIADAQAANMLTRQLLEFFGGTGITAAEKNAGNLNMSDLPPAMEERVPAKSRDKNRSYQPGIRLPTAFTWRWQRQTRVVKGELGVEVSKKLNRLLAQKQTSLHGLLSASALKFLGRQNNMDELTLLSNVELRRMCKPKLPEETFGCYIDIVRTRHRLDVPLWELAAQIKFKLIMTLARDQGGASLIKMPTWEFYRHEGWAAIKSGMRLDAITVTSAEAADIGSTCGDICLKDLTLCVSLGTVGANYFLISMEREGSLRLNLCYVHPGVSDAGAGALLENLIADLKNVVSEGD